MKHYTVYILQCADDSYYVGVTNDIDTRIVQHNDGVNRKAYTYSRRPVKVVFQEHFNDINQAIGFEKQVKGSRREKKEALINREWEKLPDLSKAYRDLLLSSSSASD
jgi:putative endonuclease